jgi:hypothetical protein
MTDIHSSMPPRTQQTCCYLSALESEATYCDECGKPLIRCMSFEECAGLLDDNGLCTVCVAPHMQIEAGALTEAKVGGSVALPISIANLSAIARPLFVTSLWSREGAGAWREERLGWEKLTAGQSRAMTITADQLEQSGVHNIEIQIEVATRWRWRQECYVFSANISLGIEDKEGKAGPIVNIGGESAGHGNTVYIAGKTNKDSKENISQRAIDLVLARAEKEERRLKLRGLEENLWVPRQTKFRWQGFPADQTPMEGPILSADGILGAGRSRTRQEGGIGDVRLLIHDNDGVVDQDLSRLISRRHFELYIECDRLILRVTGSGGVRVNGKAFGPDKIVNLHNGDVIAPLVSAENVVSLTTKFQTEHGRVSAVTFTRSCP